MLLILLAAQAASTATCADGRPVQGTSWTCPRAIYFDSGKASEIRAEWLDVLDQVAADFRQRGGRLRLDSSSDRSGSPGANRRVSAERGQAVRRALIQCGVPEAVIATVAHGEDDPLVPTPDGVREPQNRRVDITLVP